MIFFKKYVYMCTYTYLYAYTYPLTYCIGNKNYTTHKKSYLRPIHLIYLHIIRTLCLKYFTDKIPYMQCLRKSSRKLMSKLRCLINKAVGRRMLAIAVLVKARLLIYAF